MKSVTESGLPAGVDWQHWVERWERMQERYLVRRSERFAVLIELIRATQPAVTRVLDLGCGPGSTMLPILDAFPGAAVIGIDVDPVLLSLAKARLVDYEEHARLIEADLRVPDWRQAVPAPVDAVISATALHWLTARQLEQVYRQLPNLLAPGGIFLNADHLPSESAGIQEYWQQHRQLMRTEERHQDAEDWFAFVHELEEAVGPELAAGRTAALGAYEGEELPLAWHLDRLRENGFTAVDCFWRCDCDAIYGGIYNDTV